MFLKIHHLQERRRIAPHSSVSAVKIEVVCIYHAVSEADLFSLFFEYCKSPVFEENPEEIYSILGRVATV